MPHRQSTLWLITMAALLLSPAFALGSLPPAAIVKVEASDGISLLVEQVTPSTLAQPAARWRPTGHVYVQNLSGANLLIGSVAVTYQGINAPVGNSKPSGVTVVGNQTVPLPLPEDRLLSYPSPDSIAIYVTVSGYTQPLMAAFSLAHINHPTANGTYPFPMKSSLLPSDEIYFRVGSNHGFGSAHGNSQEQRFAYDFDAVRWDGSAWVKTFAGTDGSLAEHYLIWGQPVYAVANAKIVAGYRLRPDEPIGVDKSPGGNGFWMRVSAGDGETATYMLYAHMMMGSIPEELVPIEGGPGPYVTKGQFLGLVGKSGTEKPHLHFHLQRGIADFVDGAVTVGQGLPIRFESFLQQSYDGFNPDVESFAWVSGFASGFAERCLIRGEAPTWVGPVERSDEFEPEDSLIPGRP